MNFVKVKARFGLVMLSRTLIKQINAYQNQKNICFRDLNSHEILSLRAAKRALGLYLFYPCSSICIYSV